MRNMDILFVFFSSHSALFIDFYFILLRERTDLDPVNNNKDGREEMTERTKRGQLTPCKRKTYSNALHKSEERA